jgi:hypothetical protein
MMGMRMPETCWAVFKRQVINLRNCCISLIYLNEWLCTDLQTLNKKKWCRHITPHILHLSTTWMKMLRWLFYPCDLNIQNPSDRRPSWMLYRTEISWTCQETNSGSLVV